LALEPPNALGMKVRPAKSVFCLGSNPTYGVKFDWSGTTPSCTRQYVWMNFDSLADRLDATPSNLDRWTPQTGFMLDPVTPWPIGTLSLPQFPNEIYYDYTGKMADSCGRITVGLRVQNGYDPHTKQPCVDEQWYHNMLNYTNSNPEFMLDTVYGCNPLEVELTFIREFHDSLDALMINANVDFTLDNDYNKGFTYIDSVHRNQYDPRTGTYVNYVLTYYIDRTGIPKKIDSVTWVPGQGGLEGCGSELRIKTKRKLTFREPGRYAIVATSRTKDGCDNTSSVHYVVVGHVKNIMQNKTLICKDEVVEFTDTSLYLLLEPDPVTGEQFIRYNYWRDQNRFKHANGDPRTPAPYHERVRWNFGQNDQFTPIASNPIRIDYKVPGHYFIRAEFRDSIGCLDTMQLELDVTGGKANFNFVTKIGKCKPIIDFYDSSVVYDPCRLTKNVPCDSIVRWIWDFGDGSPMINTTVFNPVAPPIKNPTHVYQRFGDYEVKLIIETQMGCWDTLVRTVSIAGPQPRFDFTIDSIGCAPYTVYLGNFSIDAQKGAKWTWHFGDNSSLTTTSDSVVYHTYTQPGKYRLLLEEEDLVPLTGERCIDSFPGYPRVIEVTVLPEKKVDFTASKVEVCPNEIITFTDTSDSTYSTFIWDFGDGTVITLDEAAGGRQVTHQYQAVGTYIVRLSPDYTPAPGEPKCRQTKSIRIEVRDVKARFDIDTSMKPLFKFIDKSTNAQERWWRFGDGDDWTKCPQVDPVNCPDAIHNYGDKVGSFDVCLVVLSPEGCYDTACGTLNNFFTTRIRVPNVFTPNADDKNDQFVIDVEGWVSYEVKIYNRFSEKVFSSTDPSISWNGQMDNTGADLPAGVYYVVITYQLRGQAEQTYNGTLTLIR
ncbi:MAG: PKD domain-containing protein, partial [Bacteroidota bacterium]|nr:PKD domain-containing protein [Bacteroidota bacterium]MDX5429566.1 PKD domain-containing protein [Bacteroidota bacterium]MDX5468353.1 PKD domain-containing protein [Bacteroidota bacterium]